MTIQQALRMGISRLSRAADHRDSAALDAELLLAHVLDLRREELYAHPDHPISPVSTQRFRALVSRRAGHEPLAYITGEKEFFGLRLVVNRNVLIPRPETETLVELVIKRVGRSRALIIDVGTGSGAIAVALAKNLPAARIIATDISSKALAVARLNARRHGLSRHIRFLRADLLPLHAARSTLHADVIIANLPYLPTRVWRGTSPEIRRFEPRDALDGGRDGLDLYRKLLHQMTRLRWSSAFFEIDPHEMRTMRALIRRRFPRSDISAARDLSRRERFVVVNS